MKANPSKEKQHAHELIDRLDSAQVAAVLPLLQFMLLDPVSRSFATVAAEDEAVSAEEAAALDQARKSLDRGEGISHEDILREFGLSSR